MKAFSRLFLLWALTALPLSALAKDFETFDGRYYNGLFYPLIDIIEWGEQDKELPHLEFHIHQKDKPIDLAVVSGEKGGKPVLWIMYDLSYRGEKICRHVLAPAQFKEGQKLYLYRDNTDPDYDNIFVYSEPLKQKGKKVIPEYANREYQRCDDENASNMPEPKGKAAPPAASGPVAPRPGGVAPAPAPAVAAPAPAPSPASGSKAPAKGLIDYENTAVPFSF